MTIPELITPRRAWIAAGILCALFALVWGVSSARVASLEKRITAQQLIVAASEAEAAGHRARELELEKAMAARDVVIAAKDVLIEANSKQKAELNQQVAAEQLQFQSELAAGVDLTADQLHDRICARFAAAGIKSESYCGK